MNIDFAFPDFYTTQSQKFSGSTVSGTITSYEAVFAASTGKPRKAIFCTVPKQTFTATLRRHCPARLFFPAGALVRGGFASTASRVPWPAIVSSRTSCIARARRMRGAPGNSPS
jgi:hypothetical protein